MAKKRTAKVKPKGRRREKSTPVRAKSKPRAQALPGLEIPKIKALHTICESVADCRERLNDARKEEKDLMANALAQLQKHTLTVYKAHGVELVRVPGDERVRVRLVSDDSGGEVEDDDETVDSPAQDGAGDEAQSESL